jgi:sulfate transport system substrate-binding protein
LLRPDWPTQFPSNSVVVESVCAIVVRKGNPKNIRGWDDLGEGRRGVTARVLWM